MRKFLTTRFSSTFTSLRFQAPVQGIPPKGLKIQQISSKFLFIDSDEKSIALLLGWLAANPKHFEKYSKWYNLCQVPTISFTPSFFSMIRHKNCDFEAEEMMAHLEEKTRHHEKIILHTFSGNGLNFWLHMTKSLSDPKVFLRDLTIV
jgi:hypothetical protein